MNMDSPLAGIQFLLFLILHHALIVLAGHRLGIRGLHRSSVPYSFPQGEPSYLPQQSTQHYNINPRTPSINRHQGNYRALNPQVTNEQFLPGYDYGGYYRDYALPPPNTGEYIDHRYLHRSQASQSTQRHGQPRVSSNTIGVGEGDPPMPYQFQPGRFTNKRAGTFGPSPSQMFYPPPQQHYFSPNQQHGPIFSVPSQPHHPPYSPSQPSIVCDGDYCNSVDVEHPSDEMITQDLVDSLSRSVHDDPDIGETDDGGWNPMLTKLLAQVNEAKEESADTMQEMQPAGEELGSGDTHNVKERINLLESDINPRFRLDKGTASNHALIRKNDEVKILSAGKGLDGGKMKIVGENLGDGGSSNAQSSTSSKESHGKGLAGMVALAITVLVIVILLLLTLYHKNRHRLQFISHKLGRRSGTSGSFSPSEQHEISQINTPDIVKRSQYGAAPKGKEMENQM